MRKTRINSICLSLALASILTSCANLKTIDEVRNQSNAGSTTQSTMADSSTKETNADKTTTTAAPQEGSLELNDVLTKNAEAMSNLKSYSRKMTTVSYSSSKKVQKSFNEKINVDKKEFHGLYEGGTSAGSYKEQYIKDGNSYAYFQDAWHKVGKESIPENTFGYRFKTLGAYQSKDDFTVTKKDDGQIVIETKTDDAKYFLSDSKFDAQNTDFDKVKSENKNQYKGKLTITLDSNYRTLSIVTTPKGESDSIEIQYGDFDSIEDIVLPEKVKKL